MSKKILEKCYVWEHAGHLINENAHETKLGVEKQIGNYLGKPVLMVNPKSKAFEKMARAFLKRKLMERKP